MCLASKCKPIPESRVTDSHHVLGLRGYVFGRHWGEPPGLKVNEGRHPDWNYDVKISWKDPDDPVIYSRLQNVEPLIRAHWGHWAMFNSNLSVVETNLDFSIGNHVKHLIISNSSKIPVILEWGCGIGNAVRDLTNDPLIKGKALIFAYADIWDVDWNKVDGVKFLFFVKEHLAEYLQRAGVQLDLVFTHGAMNYLRGEELVEHIRDLATVIVPGGTILFDSNYVRSEFEQITDLFSIIPSSEDPTSMKHYLLTKK